MDLEVLRAFISFGVENENGFEERVTEIENRVSDLTAGDNNVSLSLQTDAEFGDFFQQIDDMRERLATAGDTLDETANEFASFSENLNQLSFDEVLGVIEQLENELGTLTNEQRTIIIEAFGDEEVLATFQQINEEIDVIESRPVTVQFNIEDALADLAAARGRLDEMQQAALNVGFAIDGISQLTDQIGNEDLSAFIDGLGEANTAAQAALDGVSALSAALPALTNAANSVGLTSLAR